MIKFKQQVKPIYYALKKTRVYGLFNTLNNYFLEIIICYSLS